VGFQGFEYHAGSFTLSRARFGSIFYLGTGFHGIHVCAGLILLLVAGVTSLTSLRHTILELAAWY
jgi:heme/copper-type cytochrome/quinol oxidase subunit 3